MKPFFPALLALILVPPASAWWLDADHSFGDENLEKSAVSVFFRPSARLVTGVNAGFWSHGDAYPDKVWTLRLPAMLSLADHGVLSLERVVELMCHRPARLFQVQKRGFIRPGFKADFVLLKHASHVVSSSDILSKCGWSPLEGCTLQWTVDKTFCNGHLIYNNGNIDTNSRGEAVLFNRA